MAWLCRSPSFKTVDKPQDYFKEQRLTCLKAKKLANSFFFAEYLWQTLYFHWKKNAVMLKCYRSNI